MSYTKLTDFATKDALLSGNPAKIIRGAEIDAEFSAVAVADGLNLKAAEAALIYPSKTVVQNSTAQTLSSVSGTDTIIGSLTPTLTSYVAGQTFRFVASGANTGAVTIDINSLGAKAITKSGTQPLDLGDIASGAAIQVVYDGTQFQLTSGVGGGAKAGANSDITSLSAITSINGGQLAGLRNRIINGNFGINQRDYASGAAVGAGLYGHDRWKMAASGDTYTFSITANVTTVTIPAGKVLRQVIEGLNLETGTYTLSWTGTAQGKIGAGSYGASGITGSITGGTNTTIEFGPGTVSKVQLEFGITVSLFEQRPYGTELALCQRYYYSYASGSGGFGEFGTGYLRSTTSFVFIIKYPVPMRIAPTAFAFIGTVTDYAYQVGGTACAANGINVVAFGPESSAVEFTSATASTVGFGGRAYASAGTRSLQFSAEL